MKISSVNSSVNFGKLYTQTATKLLNNAESQAELVETKKLIVDAAKNDTLNVGENNGYYSIYNSRDNDEIVKGLPDAKTAVALANAKVNMNYDRIYDAWLKNNISDEAAMLLLTVDPIEKKSKKHKLSSVIKHVLH